MWTISGSSQGRTRRGLRAALPRRQLGVPLRAAAAAAALSPMRKAARVAGSRKLARRFVLGLRVIGAAACMMHAAVSQACCLLMLHAQNAAMMQCSQYQAVTIDVRLSTFHAFQTTTAADNVSFSINLTQSYSTVNCPHRRCTTTPVASA